MLGVSFSDLGGASVRLFKQLSCIAILLLFLGGCGESREELFEKTNTGDISATKELADQGDADAQFNLGVMYYKGQGVPQDCAEAMKWYRLAADQGVARAQEMLGWMHYFGEGVPQDYTEAYAWLSIAATGGDAEVVAARDRLASKLTPEELPKAQKRATELFEKYGSGK